MSAQHPSQGTQRPAPRIQELVGEEFHPFPPRPEKNANSNSPPSQNRQTSTKAQQAWEASKANKPMTEAQKVLNSLPEGHPMRARLEQQMRQSGMSVDPTADERVAPIGQAQQKRKAVFSTKKPSRLEIERQRRGGDNEIAARTQAESDPNFMSIGVPSQFRFYEFRNLTVSCLKGIHQAKLSRAAKDGKMRYVVEAIGSTLGEGVSAFDLTPQDFYFLLYWHRLQSFPKNPQMIPFTCTNKDHVRRTILKKDHEEYLAPDTLDISTIMDATTLKTSYLEELDLTPFAELIEKYDLGVETMRDIVEFAELQEEEPHYEEAVAAVEVDPQAAADSEEESLGDVGTTATVMSDETFDEVEWLQVRSVFLRRGPGRNTILERNEIVKEMPSDDLMELDKYIEAVTDYGVSESTVLKCKGCGASHRVNLSVDALTFLP